MVGWNLGLEISWEGLAEIVGSFQFVYTIRAEVVDEIASGVGWILLAISGVPTAREQAINTSKLDELLVSWAFSIINGFTKHSLEQLISIHPSREVVVLPGSLWWGGRLFALLVGGATHLDIALALAGESA